MLLDPLHIHLDHRQVILSHLPLDLENLGKYYNAFCVCLLRNMGASIFIRTTLSYPIFRPPPSAASGPPDAPGTDLFLVCSSRLKEYRNKSGSWTSTDALIQCARKYMLDGASFDVLCEHNAQVQPAF